MFNLTITFLCTCIITDILQLLVKKNRAQRLIDTKGKLKHLELIKRLPDEIIDCEISISYKAIYGRKFMDSIQRAR